MQKGDKVVCVNTSKIKLDGNSVKHILYLNKIYTVKNPDGGANDMEVEEVPNRYFDSRRFKLLSEVRKEKIENIKNILTLKKYNYEKN